jgi:hypothetical protein
LSPASTSSGWDISSDPSKNQRPSGLLKQPGIIRSLGTHDVFTALIVEQAGFETVFVGELVCELELECYNFQRALVKATPDISHTQ